MAGIENNPVDCNDPPEQDITPQLDDEYHVKDVKKKKKKDKKRRKNKVGQMASTEQESTPCLDGEIPGEEINKKKDEDQEKQDKEKSNHREHKVDQEDAHHDDFDTEEEAKESIHQPEKVVLEEKEKEVTHYSDDFDTDEEAKHCTQHPKTVETEEMEEEESSQTTSGMTCSRHLMRKPGMSKEELEELETEQNKNWDAAIKCCSDRDDFYSRRLVEEMKLIRDQLKQGKCTKLSDGEKDCMQDPWTGESKDCMSEEKLEESRILTPVLDCGEVLLPDREDDWNILKYIHLDECMNSTDTVTELLSIQWCLRYPNLIISISGGDISKLNANKDLNDNIKNLLSTICRYTDNTWIITEGVYKDHDNCTAEYIGDWYKEIGKKIVNWKTQNGFKSNEVSLISITDWAKVEHVEQLHGLNVEPIQIDYKEDGKKQYKLQPDHKAFLLCDCHRDGKKREPYLRLDLERYYGKSREDDYGGKYEDFVLLVLGGDTFTYEKVAWAVDNNMSIVIVKGSGEIADILGEFYQELEKVTVRWFNDVENLNIEELKAFEYLIAEKELKTYYHTLLRFVEKRALVTVVCEAIQKGRDTILKGMIANIFETDSLVTTLKGGFLGLTQDMKDLMMMKEAFKE